MENSKGKEEAKKPINETIKKDEEAKKPNDEAKKKDEEAKKANDEKTEPDLDKKKPKFFDPYIPLITQVLKDVWSREKYKEIGNIQKIIRLCIKELK